MRNHLNFDWRFKRGEDTLGITQLLLDTEIVDLPHNATPHPYNYVSEKSYQDIFTYQKLFAYDPLWENQHVTLHFEGVLHQATVYLNGVHLGIHQGGYTPFSYDITKILKKGESQLLTVYADSNESLNIPPFGNVIDYLTFSGLYREVYLEIRHPKHLKDFHFYSTDLLSQPKGHLSYELSENVEGLIKIQIMDHLQIKHDQIFPIEGIQGIYHFDIQDISLWDIDHPKLYKVQIKLIENHQVLDEVSFKYGFRESVFKKDGFYLNGKKLKLMGLNRHQDYPYVGYAMPKSAQRQDAYILKHQLNCNIVRTSHYPQSKHFIEACDQLGLLVFEEIPGWQYIGDAAWKEVALKNVKEMVNRDKHHPSVVLWGVRINESGDDDPFYKKTNEIAKALDPMRQTAGVRFITHSSVLEDVFALNDFIHEGHNTPLRKLSEVTDLKDIPYLVTEHTGHMFPTKSFDPEEKRLEHAKRHMRITNHMIQDPEISGSIGWCMHDYLTHVDFGSGDKLCYHGVLDMFRNTKMAAYFYESQQGHTPYLETSSHFNIGEYPKGFIQDALIFSNCEEIHVYRNQTYIGSLKHDLEFSHLKYPPFKMDWLGDALIKYEGFSKEKSDLIKQLYPLIATYGEHHLPKDIANKVTQEDIKCAWQMYGKYVANWGSKSVSYTFKGYMNQKEVISKTKGNDYQMMIKITSDALSLNHAETYDVTRITIEALNEHQHRLVFASESLTIKTDEKLKLIGDDVISLIGGIRSFWVRTTGIAGKSILTVTHQQQDYHLELNITQEVSL